MSRREGKKKHGISNHSIVNLQIVLSISVWSGRRLNIVYRSSKRVTKKSCEIQHELNRYSLIAWWGDMIVRTWKFKESWGARYWSYSHQRINLLYSPQLFCLMMCLLSFRQVLLQKLEERIRARANFCVTGRYFSHFCLRRLCGIISRQLRCKIGWEDRRLW